MNDNTTTPQQLLPPSKTMHETIALFNNNCCSEMGDDSLSIETIEELMDDFFMDFNKQVPSEETSSPSLFCSSNKNDARNAGSDKNDIPLTPPLLQEKDAATALVVAAATVPDSIGVPIHHQQESDSCSSFRSSSPWNDTISLLEHEDAFPPQTSVAGSPHGIPTPHAAALAQADDSIDCVNKAPFQHPPPASIDIALENEQRVLPLEESSILQAIGQLHHDEENVSCAATTTFEEIQNTRETVRQAGEATSEVQILATTTKHNHSLSLSLSSSSSSSSSSSKSLPTNNKAKTTKTATTTHASLLGKMAERVVISEPTDDDYLTGRGGHGSRHPCNQRVRGLIIQLLPHYSGHRERKTFVVDCVIRDIHARGGRFLERNKGAGGGGGWVECRPEERRMKVSQRFREEASGRPNCRRRPFLVPTLLGGLGNWNVAIPHWSA